MEGGKLEDIGKMLLSFVKWIIIAAVVGAFVGIVGVFFHICVEKATEIRVEMPWLIWLLPIGGAAIKRPEWKRTEELTLYLMQCGPMNH